MWLEAEEIGVVVTTIRSQTFAPDAFGNLGLDVRQRRLVVVKSTQHFYAAFAPIALEGQTLTQRSGAGSLDPG